MNCFQSCIFAAANNQQTNEALQSTGNDYMTQNIELMQECSSLKERLEAMSANNIAIEGAIVVKSTPLFHALVKESCELESNRLNRVITPVMLLISMFNNYVVKGDFFLFRAPKRKRIIELSKEYPDGEE